MRITRVLLAGLFSLQTAALLAAEPSSRFTGPTAAQADAAISKIRELDPGLADAAARLREDLEAAAPEKLPDGGQLPKMSPEQAGELDRRGHDFIDRSQVLIADRKLPSAVVEKTLDPVFYFVVIRMSVVNLESAPMHLEEVSAALGELERRAEVLDADAKDVGPEADAGTRRLLIERLSALNAQGTRAWNRLHATALNIDDSGLRFTEKGVGKGSDEYVLTAAGKLDQKTNPLQTRVADLSRKLQEIDRRLRGAAAEAAAAAAPAQSEALRARMNGLMVNPFSRKADGARLGGTGVKSGGGAAGAPPAPGGAAEAAKAKSLLDLRHVRAPAVEAAEGPAGPRPPVFAGRKGEDSWPEATKAVNALRAEGKTRTIGDPEKRAKYVYRQEGETCALAAQVQVLADAGAVAAEPEKLKAKEDELYRQAVALGYFQGSAADVQRRLHGGTAGEYIGDMLDMPVRKRFAASEGDLFKAVSTGRIAIVSFKSAALWNNRRYNGGHVVAVTGVEVNRKDGKPLGYYINDTATEEGGRFVTVRQFMGAWKVWGSVLIEPL